MRFTTLNDWLAWQERLHHQEIDLGLERVMQVWRRLASRDMPGFSVITVGGTNGKGSSVAMLDAILRAAGYRVGTYSSPHILRYNERVKLHGAEVSDELLCQAFQRVDEARGDVTLSYFEFGTLAALDIFGQAGLDVVVLEVGMGGRLDAVNILDADVALITNVALDHRQWLGNDRESIAREKAGIMRAGRPAVFVETDVPQSLRRHAEALGARLYVLGTDFGYERGGQDWRWWSRGHARGGLPIPALRGECQLRNAAGALMALELISERLPVTQADIRNGLLQATVPGRFQVLPGLPRLVLDVAHNPHGAHALAGNLRSHPLPGRTLAVLGMLKDKDIGAAVFEMMDVVDAWFIGGIDVPRGADAEFIAAELARVGVTAPVHRHADVQTACHAARMAAGPADQVVIFGSFHTVAAALRSLEDVGSESARCGHGA